MAPRIVWSEEDLKSLFRELEKRADRSSGYKVHPLAGSARCYGIGGAALYDRADARPLLRLRPQCSIGSLKAENTILMVT